jgi:hypothetical protein
MMPFVAALRGKGALHFAKHAHLVLREVPRRAMSLCPLDGFPHFLGVHPNFGWRFALPHAGSGEIGASLRLRSLPGQPGSQHGRQYGQSQQ